MVTYSSIIMALPSMLCRQLICPLWTQLSFFYKTKAFSHEISYQLSHPLEWFCISLNVTMNKYILNVLSYTTSLLTSTHISIQCIINIPSHVISHTLAIESFLHLAIHFVNSLAMSFCYYNPQMLSTSYIYPNNSRSIYFFQHNQVLMPIVIIGVKGFPHKHDVFVAYLVHFITPPTPLIT